VDQLCNPWQREEIPRPPDRGNLHRHRVPAL